jgi:hypothetical protein
LRELLELSDGLIESTLLLLKLVGQLICTLATLLQGVTETLSLRLHSPQIGRSRLTERSDVLTNPTYIFRGCDRW